VPQDFSERLKAFDISNLDDLVVKAVSIESLPAFESLVNTLKEKSANGAAN